MTQLATTPDTASSPDTVAPGDAVPGDAAVRDVAAIDTHAWPLRPLPPHLNGHRQPQFQVVFAQSALDLIHLHGQSAASIEVCGVLVGHGCVDADGAPYLLISHAIRGNGASSRSTNVTFTADTWQHIQLEMEQHHADETIVGWYHTHPSFGIFLSEMDEFICQHFFDLPWQCAFVYDPISGEEGNFVWRRGRPVREPVLIEDDVTPQAAAVPLIPVSEAMSGGAQTPAPTEQLIDLLIRVRRLERRQKLLAYALIFVAAFAAMLALQQPLMQSLMHHPDEPATQAPPAATKVNNGPAAPAAPPKAVAAPNAAPAAGAHNAVSPATSLSPAPPPAPPAPKEWPPAPVPEVIRP